MSQITQELRAPRIVIEAGHTEAHYWRDLVRYWELLLFLAWRDVAIRYKQTVVGITWVLVRPLVTVLVLTVVFGRLAKLQSAGDVPYVLLVMAAMLPWQLFSNVLTASSSSLVGNASLISKVYFPRLLIPASSVLSNLVDFVFTAVLLVIMMVVLGQPPHWSILLTPFAILLAMTFAGGLGLWLGALNVRYRDVTHVVPFVVQFGLYVSPVGFSSSVVPEQWRTLYSLNPLVGIIDFFRWCLLGPGFEPSGVSMLISVLMTLVILAGGIWYFRKTERTFADLI